jgi:hypothetical protein
MLASDAIYFTTFCHTIAELVMVASFWAIGKNLQWGVQIEVDMVWYRLV